MFSKKERNTLSYMFARWHAFNMIALNLKCWKFKYIFYDIDKIFCKLFGFDIREWHKKHSRHHIEYLDNHSPNDIDWDMVFIGWHCSQILNSIKPNNDGIQLMLSSIAYPDHIDFIMKKYEEFVEKYNIN